MTVWCRECDGANAMPRNWIEESDACKYCGTKGQWRTLNEPKAEYLLNHNDRRFLRSMRIKAD